MRKVSGIIVLAAVASLAVACGDSDPPGGTGGTVGTGGTIGTGGTSAGGTIGDGGTGGTTTDPGTDTGTTVSTWDGGYPTYFGSDFVVAGPIYTYVWAGSTCTLIPADGDPVTSDDNITVSGCVDDGIAVDPYAGGGFAFAFCAAPGETWDELVAAVPSMATWVADSKHTWAECNPSVNLVDVTIPGLPACAEIEFQDADDLVVTDKNTAVSVNVKVDGENGCNVENLDLSYSFTVG